MTAAPKTARLTAAEKREQEELRAEVRADMERYAAESYARREAEQAASMAHFRAIHAQLEVTPAVAVGLAAIERELGGSGDPAVVAALAWVARHREQQLKLDQDWRAYDARRLLKG